MGRGQFGRARTDEAGNLVRDDKGNMIYDQDLRADQGRLLAMIEGNEIDKDTLQRKQILDPQTGQMVNAPSFRDFVDQDFQTRLVDPYSATARDDREKGFYDKLQALRAPEQERGQAELAQNLAAQGRTGVRTAMYGGTPEELAWQKRCKSRSLKTQYLRLVLPGMKSIHFAVQNLIEFVRVALNKIES